MPFRIISDSYRESQPIPTRHTCDDVDLSPAVRWEEVPEQAKSLVLILEDPDAPQGTFTHWVLFDIPANVKGLREGEDGVGKSALNDFRVTGYRGPCPPAEHDAHRYFLRLYALDVEMLGPKEGAPPDVVRDAMANHILAEAQTMGTYKREG